MIDENDIDCLEITEMNFKGIGKKIKDARVKQGMTQSDLAKKVGVHVTTISSIEIGSKRSGVVLLSRVAVALGIKFKLSIPVKEKVSKSKSK